MGRSVLVAKVPEIVCVEDDFQGYVGESCIKFSSRKLTLLRRLGYISMEMRSCKVQFDPNRDIDLLRFYMAGDFKIAYDVTVLRELPWWYSSLELIESSGIYPAFEEDDA